MILRRDTTIHVDIDKASVVAQWAKYKNEDEFSMIMVIQELRSGGVLWHSMYRTPGTICCQSINDPYAVFKVFYFRNIENLLRRLKII